MSQGEPIRTRRTGGATAAAAVLPVRLVASDGPGAGARAELSTGTALIGSGPGVDLRLADDAVSRRHATVELMPGAVRVKDLGSTNGTFYLGARIDQARVPVGSSVRIGKTTVRFDPVLTATEVSQKTELAGLIGGSLAMRRLFALLERLGPTESTVLIEGETGSGKEGVARALHQLSPRAKKPFVVLDCAAISPSLIEAELFGHARGAFTGADRARAGVVEAAEGGTLLLDEIGELPLQMQPRLLRLLEARELRRVGENQVRKTNVRVLAATHRALRAEAAAGRFREDLYFRLAVAEVRVPPLRERVEDIVLLARHFAAARTQVTVALSDTTLAALQCDPWPGNVRELRNAVERVLTLGEGGPALAADPALEPSFKQARANLLEQFERDYVVSILQRYRGNVAKAARAAKLSRNHIYRLLERHQLG